MRILTLTTTDISNGLGCRVTVWVAGCSHHCPGCHNPESWDYNQGIPIEDIYETLFNELDKPYIKGVTFSGGDPMAQDEDSLKQLYELCQIIKTKYPEKDIWIWAGEVYELLITDIIKKSILELCDVLVDGPFILAKKDRHIAFRGSTNQRIIDLNKSFKSNNIIEMDIH